MKRGESPPGDGTGGRDAERRRAAECFLSDPASAGNERREEMKKLVIAALAAGAMSVPAMAQTGGIVLGAPQFGNYANRGQCESALAHERNKQRKTPSTRGSGYEDLSGSDFNRASQTTTRCEERNGHWVVVYYANGF
jgi:hypothetical protein